jgi:serine/threonine protein kinase
MRTHSVGNNADGVYEIDPANLSERDSKMLYAFLKKQMAESKSDEIDKDRDYDFTYTLEGDDGEIIKINKIKLTKYVIRTGREPNKRTRYNVVSKKHFARGAFGFAYDIECALIPNDTKQTLRKFIYRTAVMDKIQTHHEGNPEQEANNEVDLLSADPTQRVRGIIFSEESQDEIYGDVKRSHIVIRKHEGLPLDKILKEKPLSIDQRIQLALDLLLALKEFHSRGLIHRDIKPGNIIANYDKDLGIWRIKLIDFGSVKRSNIPTIDHPGTPAYSSPESLLNKVYNEKSDLYSMGLILGQVFGAKGPISGIPPAEFTKRAEKKLGADCMEKSQVFVDLLKDIDKKDIDVDLVEELLMKATMSLGDGRDSVDEAIVRLDQIKLNHILKNFDKKNHENIRRAYQAAAKARDELSQIAINNINSVRDNPRGPLQPMVDSINQAMEEAGSLTGSLKDDALRIFINTLGVDAFKDAKSASEISQIAKNNLMKFEDKSNALFDLEERVELGVWTLNLMPSSAELEALKKELRALLYDIDSVLRKHTKHDIKFDDLSELGQKWDEKFIDLSTRVSVLMDQHKGYKKVINAYEPIYTKLELQNAEPEDKLSQLKNAMRIAIKNYLDKSLTSRNIRKEDGAASSRRIKDIEDLLQLIESEDVKSEADLIAQTKQRLRKIEVGKHIGFLNRSIGFRSQLRSNLLAAMEPYEPKHSHRHSHRVVKKNGNR